MYIFALVDVKIHCYNVLFLLFLNITPLNVITVTSALQNRKVLSIGQFHYKSSRNLANSSGSQVKTISIRGLFVLTGFVSKLDAS